MNTESLYQHHQVDDHIKFIKIVNLLQNNGMEALPVIKTTKWRETPIYTQNDWNYNIVKNM